MNGMQTQFERAGEILRSAKRKTLWLKLALLNIGACAGVVLSLSACGKIARPLASEAVPVGVAGVQESNPQSGGTPSLVASASPTPLPARLLPVVSPTPAQQLEVFFVYSGEDHALPDRSLNLASVPRTGMNEILASDREVIFKNTVLVAEDGPRNRPLFLAWDEVFLGQPIREAFFEYRIQNLRNQTLGEVDRFSASYDEPSRRWFIPLRRMIQSSVSHLDPTHCFLVTLDLILRDGSRHSIQIRFRLVGPMPRLNVQNRSLGGPIPASELFRYLGEAGAVVKRVEVTNPSPRSLSLWVRAVLVRPLRAVSLIGHSFFSANDEEARRGAGFERLISIAPLSLQFRYQNISVWRSAPVRTTAEVWQRIPIGPMERVVLDWIGLPQGNPVRCTLPTATSRQLVWFADSRSPNPEDQLLLERPLTFDSTRTMMNRFIYRRELRESWRLQRLSLDGEWNIEARVASGEASLEEATARPGADETEEWVSYRTLAQSIDAGSFQSSSLSEGGLPSLDQSLGLPHFTCQGLF